jgi:ferric-dicitrate binding protein FerR (iron transport regulator)
MTGSPAKKMCDGIAMRDHLTQTGNELTKGKSAKRIKGYSISTYQSLIVKIKLYTNEISLNRLQVFSNFSVLVRGLSVQVFGTTFNVNENTDTNEIIVSLLEGSVQVVDDKEQLLASLLPGKQLLFSEGKSTLRDAENMSALTSWINNTLVFENQPLQDVIGYLQGWYGIKICLDPELLQSQHRYTFKVKTESLRDVLDMISVITPITYKIEGENVTISYK